MGYKIRRPSSATERKLYIQLKSYELKTSGAFDSEFAAAISSIAPLQASLATRDKHSDRANIHIGLSVPKKLWEQFCIVAQSYDDLPTRSVLRQIRQAVETHHIYGFQKLGL